MLHSRYPFAVTLGRDFDYRTNQEIYGTAVIDIYSASSIREYDGQFVWEDYSNSEIYPFSFWDRSGEFYVVSRDLGGYHFGVGYSQASIDISGGDYGDVIYGGTAADKIFGGAGRDHLYGSLGDDRLDGGVDADRLVGGDGHDTYVVDNLRDRITELANNGTDTVEASVNFKLGVNVENLSLTGTDALRGTGNELSNVIIGNAGANILSGGDGNDTLIGGLGADRLTGGGGADTFVFRSVDDSRSAAHDLIIDFFQAQGDRIDLSGIDPDLGTAGDQAFSFEGGAFNVTGPDAQVIVTKAGSHALVQADLNGDQAADFSILVRGAVTLGASDFVL